MNRCVSTLLVPFLLAPTLAAQLVVDPSGGGTHTDLQDAIDAAPPGGVIRVVGGAYGPLMIAKSLTILGDPAPTIRASAEDPARPSSPQRRQPAAIALAGNGSDTLTLGNVIVTGAAYAFSWTGPGPGIEGDGFAELRIVDSLVRAHDSYFVTGPGPVPGAAGIAVSAQLVVLADAHVRASAAWSWPPAYHPAPSGEAGIEAPGATVLAVGSTIAGGDAGELWFVGPPAPAPCPCPSLPGLGGPAIDAARVFSSDTVAVGGQGGAVFYGTGPGPAIAWGQQPSGASLAAAETHELRRDLWQLAPLELGRSWTLVTLARTPVLLMGALADAPLPLGTDWLFVDPSNYYATAQPPTGTFVLRVPAVPALAGLEIAVQSYDVARSQSRLSAPLFGLIGF